MLPCSSIVAVPVFPVGSKGQVDPPPEPPLRGHELSLEFRVAEHWNIAGTFFSNTVNIGHDEEDEGYKRLQIDLIFKF